VILYNTTGISHLKVIKYVVTQVTSYNFQRLLISAFCSGHHQTIHQLVLKKTTHDRLNAKWQHSPFPSHR